jgi:hypothetical protein
MIEDFICVDNPCREYRVTQPHNDCIELVEKKIVEEKGKIETLLEEGELPYPEGQGFPLHGQNLHH